jgi:uncharacterized protein (UPF0371 family)
VDALVGFFGWTEADLAKYNINLHSNIVTFALAIATVWLSLVTESQQKLGQIPGSYGTSAFTVIALVDDKVTQ